jgi:hypothetical protein
MDRREEERLVDELPELRMLQWSVFSDAPRANKDL